MPNAGSTPTIHYAPQKSQTYININPSSPPHLPDLSNASSLSGGLFPGIASLYLRLPSPAALPLPSPAALPLPGPALCPHRRIERRRWRIDKEAADRAARWRINAATVGLDAAMGGTDAPSCFFSPTD
uniref:Uncharacterized protein n=1 Tax=Oryza meridionalis TaxID=40149 RepID=A0A0E0ERX4_9ORYZ